MKVFSLILVAAKRDGGTVAPRTKKNSPQLIPRMKFPILVPSEAYREWERAALSTLVRAGVVEKLKDSDGKARYRYPPGAIAFPVNCRALVYRDRNVGDSCGFYQAVGDMLQMSGILADDRYIVSWDGSRLLKCAARPRVEIELTSVCEVNESLELLEEEACAHG